MVSKMSTVSTAGAVCQPPTPKLKDYVFTEKLGSGTYGDVYKVKRPFSLVILNSVHTDSPNFIPKKYANLFVG